jgi:hypothetical protein
MRLKLILLEDSLIPSCICSVERRGIAGPDGDRRFWIVKTKKQYRYVGHLPPTKFLIIGPGGKDQSLDYMKDDVIDGIGIQAMQDLTGLAPKIDSFQWTSVYYFAKGFVFDLDARLQQP